MDIKKNELIVSLVIYKNDFKELTIAINSALKSNLVTKIYLIDNSPTDILKTLKNINDEKIEYLFQNANIGFGKGHNIAMQISIDQGFKYHLILNPDIEFGSNVLDNIYLYMEDNLSCGVLMPRIENHDGTQQNLPKLLPSPSNIIMRKFKFPKSLYNDFINTYELRFVPKDKIYNTPVLSGCFSFYRVEALKKTGLFDDKFFMYFEDWDLSRRIHEQYETIYYPIVSVFHGYHSGANKSFKLFKIYIKSAFIYFNKWGWLFDSQRKVMNKKALSQF